MIVAKAKVIKKGRRVAFAEAEVFSENGEKTMLSPDFGSICRDDKRIKNAISSFLGTSSLLALAHQVF
ncbi:MAG: hypothetical protein MZV70_30605 [Desulfobacterales bacterium]|nr:hypothetical protein [Desulfobacterales bacterium]